MRTLKKTLCLVLALVMMLGLCAVSAAATDLPDDDKIGNDYREAFELANYLKIITGAEVGGQVVANPQGNMTRVQGCYYIARLLKGNYGAGTASQFTDVSGQDAAVVEWMAAQGYTAGNGDGTFDPYGTMLGMHFAKWLLTALGYDAEIEGMTGAGDKWEGQVRLLTAKTGLTRGISGYDQNAVLTREQAAQMVLNALEADMVEYRNSTTVNQGGFNVTISGTAQPMQKTGEGNANYNGTGEGANGVDTIQLIELYYPTMKKVMNTGSTVSAKDLNTPMAYSWEDGGKEVLRVLDTPVVTYTNKVGKASDVASDLSGYYIKVGETKTYVNTVGLSGDTKTGTDFLYVNGAKGEDLDGTAEKFEVDGKAITIKEKASVAEMIAGLTERGREVEIYASKDKEITKIVVTCYTVAKVNKISTDNGTTTYSFSQVIETGSVAEGKTYTAVGQEDSLVCNDALAKDDIVMITSNGEDLKTDNGTTTLFAYKLEKNTGKQTRYTSDGKVTIDGTVYNIAAGVARKNDGTTLLGKEEFKDNVEVEYYLDYYGNLVYAKALEKSGAGDYAFIVAASGKVETGLDGAKPIITVRAVLSDGTWGEYTVATEIKKVEGEANAANKTATRYAPADNANQYKVYNDFNADYYVIKNTDIIVSGGGDEKVDWKSVDDAGQYVTTNNAAKLLMGDLYGYVYSYKLNGSELELTPLGNTTGTGKDKMAEAKSNYAGDSKMEGTTYTGQTSSEIVKGKQSYTSTTQAMVNENVTGAGTYGEPGTKVDNTLGANVAVSSNTTFIVFNNESGKMGVEVYNGLSNLPAKTESSSIGYYVGEGSGTKDDKGILEKDTDGTVYAKLVFIVRGGGVKDDTSTSTKEYIYIDSSKTVTHEGAEKDAATYYQAWRAGDSKSFEVKDDKNGTIDKNGTGLYYIDENNVVTEVKFSIGDGKTDTENTITKDAPFFYVAGAEVVKVNGVDQIVSKAKSATDENQNWTIGDVTPSNKTDGKIEGQKLIVILKVTGGNLTTDIETIFAV